MVAGRGHGSTRCRSSAGCGAAHSAAQPELALLTYPNAASSARQVKSVFREGTRQETGLQSGKEQREKQWEEQPSPYKRCPVATNWLKTPGRRLAAVLALTALAPEGGTPPTPSRFSLLLTSSFLELKETKWATSQHFFGWPEDAKWSWHFSQNRGFKRALAQVCGTLILVRPSGDSCRGRKQGYEDGPGGIFNTGSELLGYPVGS